MQLLMESQDAFARCQAASLAYAPKGRLMAFFYVDFLSPAPPRPFVLFLAQLLSLFPF